MLIDKSNLIKPNIEFYRDFALGRSDHVDGGFGMTHLVPLVPMKG